MSMLQPDSVTRQREPFFDAQLYVGIGRSPFADIWGSSGLIDVGKRRDAPMPTYD